MKFLFFVLPLLALGAASDVIDLTDANFATKSAGHDIMLIEFFAPWCGHCKRLAPEYEKAATRLAHADPPVALAKVDCTVETAVCSKYGVSGYPTLKIFKNGEMASDYDGPREADGIVKFMLKKAGPVSRELKTVAEAEKFIENYDHSVIGFFEEGSDSLKDFMRAADSLGESFRFAHTTSKEILDKYNHKNKVVLYQPPRLRNTMEKSEFVFDEKIDNSKLKRFLESNAHGLAGHRTSGNQEQFQKPLVVVYYAVDYIKNPKGSNYWRNRVMKVAKKFKDAGKTINFAIANKDDFRSETDELGLEGGSGDKPVVGARDAKNQKFPMKGEFSMESLEAFANDMLDGKLEPYLKSEPVPTPNDDPVKIVVAKNFDEIVNDPDRDVLIEFYAPWCGHCKTLAPKYDELATKLIKETGITIAKMDATANDVPSQYTVTGFPTLYFAPKGSKNSPKRYEGGREIDDFIKYLAREASDPLQGYTRDGEKKKKSKDDGEL